MSEVEVQMTEVDWAQAWGQLLLLQRDRVNLDQFSPDGTPSRLSSY